MKVHSSTWTRAGNTLSLVSSPDRQVAVRPHSYLDCYETPPP